MNSKAFFTFILVIAFAFFLLFFLSASLAMQKNSGNALRLSLMLEKSSLERFVLEQNTDFLIEKTIESQALKKQLTSEQVKLAINSSLSNYFQSNDGFSFFETEFPFLNNYSKLSTANAVPLLALSDEFKVNVVRLEKHLFLVEASYAGSISGKKLVFGAFNSADINQFFLIPFGYSVRKLVVS